MMELRQDLDKGKATFTAVSEFLLTHPVLSFGVRDVAQSRLRHTEVLPAEEESESLTTGLCMCARALKLLKTRNCFFFVLHVYIFAMFLLLEGTQGPTESKSGIQIKLYCVHTKYVSFHHLCFTFYDCVSKMKLF